MEEPEASPLSLVTRPKAKIDLLRAEVALRGSGRLTKAGEIAAALGIKPSTFSEWFGAYADAHGSRPPRTHLATIANIFGEYGVCIETEWFFEELEAFAQRLIATRSNRQTAAPVDVEFATSSHRWEIADGHNVRRELAALSIHLPPPTNSPNTFRLPVTLSIGCYPDEIGDLPVQIGLKAAYLVPIMKGCQPAEIPENEHMEESGGTFTVRGPKVRGVLNGKPLERTTLLTAEFTSDTPSSVTLELRSRKLDLEVVPDDPTRSVSANRLKVLQRFLQECQVADEDRRVIWCRASLCHRDTDATNT